MEKTLTIDGRPIRFKSTAAFMLRYKAQFGRDPLQDVFRLKSAIGEDGQIRDISTLDLEVIYNLVWVLAKTADPTIPPPMEWLDGFSEFPLEEIVPEIVDMISNSMGSSVESKKK